MDRLKIQVEWLLSSISSSSSGVGGSGSGGGSSRLYFNSHKRQYLREINTMKIYEHSNKKS